DIDDMYNQSHNDIDVTLSYTANHSTLHSFPTRRSSDLSTRSLLSSMRPFVRRVVTRWTWAPSLRGSERLSSKPQASRPGHGARRSEEHTSELQSPCNLVCRLLLEKKKKYITTI